MKHWQGKHVLITGAAGGLGTELSLLYGQLGATILAVDLQLDGLTKLSEKLVKKNIEHAVYPCDITDPVRVEETVQQIIAEYKGLDLVIQNAGTSHRSPFAETKLHVLEKVIQVNVHGALNVTHFTLPHIVKRQGGYIAISSVAGFAPLYGRTAYAASKHAIQGFFETLRAEVADNHVHIMVVCPSFIKTAMEHRAMGADGSHVRNEKKTIGQVLSPQFVAQKIVTSYDRGKKRLIIGKMAWTSKIVNTLFPSFYSRMMKKQIEEEFKSSPSST